MGNFLKLSDDQGRLNLSALTLGLLLLLPVIAFASPRAFSFFIPACGILLFVGYVWSYKKIPLPIKNKEPALWLCSVLGLAAISSFWSVDFETSFERTQKLACIFLPSLLLVAVISNIKLQFCRRFCLIFAGMSVCLVILEFSEIWFDYPIFRVMNGESDTSIHASRLNRSLVALSVTLIISAVLLKMALPKNKKYLSFAVLLAIIPLIVFGESQSMILAFIFALIVFFLFPYGQKWAWYLMMTVVGVLFIATPFLVSYLYTEFADTVSQTTFVGRDDGYGAERLEIWDMVARYAMQSPLYGHGIEATRAITDFTNGGKFRSSNTVLHPHNFVLQIWIEFGLIGVIFALSFLLRLFWGIQKMPYQKARFALALTVFTLTVASFAYGLWQSWFIGFMIALYVIFIAYDKMLESDAYKKHIKDNS